MRACATQRCLGFVQMCIESPLAGVVPCAVFGIRVCQRSLKTHPIVVRLSPQRIAIFPSDLSHVVEELTNAIPVNAQARYLVHLGLRTSCARGGIEFVDARVGGA